MRGDEIQDNLDDEEESDSEETNIRWSNLIFLPFNPVFNSVVVTMVIIKTILGPIQSVYPIVYCWNTMDYVPFLVWIKILYLYICDPIYGVDTFLHILHRQVTDEAMRREHLPKSAFLLLLDIISLIPFYRLVSDESCEPAEFYPNILSFTEFVIIYRVADSFSLITTHNYIRIVCGYTIMLAIGLNCIASFLLLLTMRGLCKSCLNGLYDWRIHVVHKLNETDHNYCTYVYGVSITLSYIVNKQYDEIKPATLSEYVLLGTLMISGSLLVKFIVFPKMVAEALLRLRKRCSFYPEVTRIVEETHRRNATPNAYKDVQKFYDLLWKKRNGITEIPDVISELPRNLRLDIKHDLVWPVFYHSPTLRNTSSSFKRWLCDYIHIDYKMPGEKFYAGPHCHSHLYYIKAGIVQVISADDGTTPLISVTSGTIFGDISFYLPYKKKASTVRCLTYCEVLYIERIDILNSLHKYPEDRRMVMELTKERIKHAKILHSCKQLVRGLDRTEDEGIAWVKKRWWEILDAVSVWKTKSTKNENKKCEIPGEEVVYHCAKYIGQLVLCSDIQLQTKSLFANVKFPWIFVPESSFGRIWNTIVTTTVFLVLILYPPYITRQNIPMWFKFFQFWVNCVYIFDICVSLLTSIVRHENITNNFASVMFTRCKSPKFALDVLSTVWLEDLAVITGVPEYYFACQFNRLIKVYVLFPNWDAKTDPLYDACYKIVLVHYAFVYIVSYLLLMIDRNDDKISTSYFYGEVFCKRDSPEDQCDFERVSPFYVVLAWTLEFIFYEYLPNTLMDMYVAIIISYMAFIVCVFCEANLVGSLYLKYREITNYQYLVANIKSHYNHHKIHPDLLKRLNRYLLCHWKYYHGMDIMQPNLLRSEPYDIYWKVHGEIAVKVIKESRAFIYADLSLIRELAFKSKFLVLPKNSSLIVFGLNLKNISYIIQGSIMCEYPNEKGELLRKTLYPGEFLSALGVFFGCVSLKTLTTMSECEILYIPTKDFIETIKRFPHEWSYYQTAVDELSTDVRKIVQDYVEKHTTYKLVLRKSIFHAKRRGSEYIASTSTTEENENRKEPKKLYSYISGGAWIDPHSRFMHYWMPFRAVLVIISITCASLQGGSGAIYRYPFVLVGNVCDLTVILDIFFKIFLGYYDARGLLITNVHQRTRRYISRGFVCDLVGCLPWPDMINQFITEPITGNQALLINTFSKFAHLYLFIGYFNYMADMPNVNFAFLMIIKWFVVTLLVMLGAGHFFVSHCISFDWDSTTTLVGMQRLNHCWLPNYFPLSDPPTVQELHMVYAESLNLAQSAFMRFNLGKFQIDRINGLSVGIMLLMIGFMFWYIICYTLTLLVLNYRGNTIFQHSVNQLRRFLKAELVDKNVITLAVSHFRYWWFRTKGINIQSLMNERLGVIFKQDLTYYFFKKTVEATETLLKGGESLEREIASAATQLYFLPGEIIAREMDLNPWVFIVHRGKIVIKREGKKIARLTKGSIFGQLDGLTARPLRISAVSDEYADLLQISIKEFQDIIGDKGRENIAQNAQSKYDYMAVEKVVTENPYNTVDYLLRGQKSIQFPWMSTRMIAQGWYSHWLYLTWLICPVIASFAVLFLVTVPEDYDADIFVFLLLFDVVHLLHIATEFYSTKLVVVYGRCEDKVVKWRIFKKWQTYVDLISFIIPVIAYSFGNRHYALFRLLRLRLLYDFHKHFCKGFQSTIAPILLKFVLIILLLHCMTCGWIYVACRDSEFPLDIPPIPPDINATIDYAEWTLPYSRKGGCARLTKNYIGGNKNMFGFLVPLYWTADYLVAMIYIIIIYTHTEIDIVVALTLKQIYYKLFINFIIYPADIWILSIAISAVYTKLRELYTYDYQVNNLVTYLHRSGLSPMLLDSVRQYTEQLWKRQRGNWLPELAQHAHHCLREDLLGALYIHHLQTVPIFRDLPEYFNRQLVARLRRVVIFPGKLIVQEGDIVSLMHFIHEGEVEKWYTNKDGERKMVSILNTNGYFGLVPALFPNAPFQFTYFSRTVVDIVFLRFRDWQDLLEGYPDIKKQLYELATKYRKEIQKVKLYEQTV
ncbi:uncharacterized protein LOC112050590 [Bicyclus anynana]|uniref:Uncharacterized protein LOC112050590 n=1 Tax=Bicyclus anynana TaxID=110368 RepID=A0ABM3LR11_BICAN|nr:uncharacterized protein LOC112050590 [Bicyclus anynana]